MKLLLRRVVHENETEKKKAERYLTNTTFVCVNGNNSLKLLPVPDFMENTCSMPNCDKPAICMIDFGNSNYRTICEPHLRSQFPEIKLVQEKALVVPSIEQAVRGNAFEWAVLGKDNWYKVRGTNIIYDSEQRISKKEMQERFSEVMSQVLNDNIQTRDGEYIKEEKKLIIYV